jgi:hypothetical protein
METLDHVFISNKNKEYMNHLYYLFKTYIITPPKVDQIKN